MSERAIRAGRAAIELFLDDEGLKRQIGETRRRLSSMGRTLLSVGTQLTVLGGAIAGPFALAISAASDLQETVSKFEVVFGTQTAAVREWATSFAGEVGRAKRQVLDFLASTQDLLVPIGIDPQQAAELSKQISTLAVDLGSFNNVADADALRDLQAALTGSGETMKKYGVIVNEAAVKQELLNRGLDPSQASEAEKVLSRLAIIMRGTTAAQGDAVRTAGSFANQMKALQGTLADTAATVGQAVLPAVTQFVNAANQVIRPLVGWVEANGALVISVAATGVVLTGLGITVIGLGSAVSALATVFAALGAVVATIGAPATAVAVAIVGIVAVTTDWRNLLGDLGRVADNTFKGIEASLTSGNIERAAEIAALGMKVAFLSAFSEMTNGLTDFAASVAASGVFGAGIGDAVGGAVASGVETAFNSKIAEAERQLHVLRQKSQEEAEKAKEAAKAREEATPPPPTPPPPATPPGQSEEDLEKQEKEAKQLFDQTRSAAERRASEMQRLAELLQAGAITEDTYQRSLKRVNDEFTRNDEATQERIRNEKELQKAREDARKALEAEADAVKESVKTPEQRFEEARKRLEELRSKNLITKDEFDKAVEREKEPLLADDKAKKKAREDEANSIRESIKSPLDRFLEQQQKIRDLGADGFLKKDEVSKAIANAREELSRADGNVSAFTRRTEPVFADVARLGLGTSDVPRNQLIELQKIRKATEEGLRNRRVPRVGR